LNAKSVETNKDCKANDYRIKNFECGVRNSEDKNGENQNCKKIKQKL